ncbi:sugar phosphate isomerase/epimerase family protein [Sphingobacterium suaedae]|uniref:Sugar phosphate isomerase/epimerase family protein n=1 Tax=Sphingobacterium suaedae TaxID=1686402 RepID=A0ABW5KFJ4_9SPHI
MRKIHVILITMLIAAQGVRGVAQTTDVPALGVCASLDKANLLKQQGYQFIQPTVEEVLRPQLTNEAYQLSDTLVGQLPVALAVCNVFIPGAIKTTGPDVDEARVMAYATRVFERARKQQIGTIVFGSGASRNIPEGFDRDVARRQFVSMGRKLAELAATYHIVLALESQNKQECNFINTLRESIEIAKEVAHPNFRVTVDTYHMAMEKESPSHILLGKGYIHHCDIGELHNRAAPGVNGDDFTPYFQALQHIGFHGKIALECRFVDMHTELPKARQVIIKQWEEARSK